jgi:integrase/recombinase XerD
MPTSGSGASPIRRSPRRGRVGSRARSLHLHEIDTRKLSEIVKFRRDAGVTNATIRRDLGAISSVLGYAEAEGWREDNPALVWLRRVRERRDPIMLPENQPTSAK